jgi:hypothetical protein
MNPCTSPQSNTLTQGFPYFSSVGMTIEGIRYSPHHASKEKEGQKEESI